MIDRKIRTQRLCFLVCYTGMWFSGMLMEDFLLIERSYWVAEAIIYIAVYVRANFVTTH